MSQRPAISSSAAPMDVESTVHNEDSSFQTAMANYFEGRENNENKKFVESLQEWIFRKARATMSRAMSQELGKVNQIC
jgi:hypothetical protein